MAGSLYYPPVLGRLLLPSQIASAAFEYGRVWGNVYTLRLLITLLFFSPLFSALRLLDPHRILLFILDIKQG